MCAFISAKANWMGHTARLAFDHGSHRTRRGCSLLTTRYLAFIHAYPPYGAMSETRGCNHASNSNWSLCNLRCQAVLSASGLASGATFSTARADMPVCRIHVSHSMLLVRRVIRLSYGPFNLLVDGTECRVKTQSPGWRAGG